MKRILGILLVLSLSAMVGCSGTSSAASSIVNTQPSITSAQLSRVLNCSNQNYSKLFGAKASSSLAYNACLAAPSSSKALSLGRVFKSTEKTQVIINGDALSSDLISMIDKLLLAAMQDTTLTPAVA
ncbi:MAG: hypothetical protein WCK49_02515 [Myxococcaceae bacterium]